MGLHDSSYLIQGKRYRLQYRRLRGKQRGYCDAPDAKQKRILVHYTPRRRSWTVLEDLIHECLHASGWSLSHEWIEQTAKDLTRILVDQGFCPAKLE